MGFLISRSGTVALMWPLSAAIITGFAFYNGSSPRSRSAYPPPINHKGINRLALTVPDVERAVKILEAQGVPFLSEVAPCCSGTYRHRWDRSCHRP